MKEKKRERKILECVSQIKKNIILEYVKTYHTIKANTPELFNQLGIKHYRALEDILTYLEKEENILIRSKVGKAYVWAMKDKEYFSKELINYDTLAIDYLLSDFQKDSFNEKSVSLLKKVFKGNDNMIGKLPIIEELRNESISNVYDKLENSIKKSFYLQLRFISGEPSLFMNVKPIKLIFIDNNWYVAFEYKNHNDKNKEFRLGRLSFIESVEYLKDLSYSDKKGFQKKDLKHYLNFLDNDLQNSMTFYGVKTKEAILQASTDIARYFKKDMKKFMISQKFLKEENDGTILFSITYTNSLEILPFIQKWMPDITILKPIELQIEYKKKLELAIASY